MVSFVDVRDLHTGKMLFRFDPERDLVEIRSRQKVTLVDLTQYRVQLRQIEYPFSEPCPEGFIEVSTIGDIAQGKRVAIPVDRTEFFF